MTQPVCEASRSSACQISERGGRQVRESALSTYWLAIHVGQETMYADSCSLLCAALRMTIYPWPLVLVLQVQSLRALSTLRVENSGYAGLLYLSCSSRVTGCSCRFKLAQ